MRGYTAKKGNRYYAVIYEGIDPATGKERRRWYPAGPRKSDAQRLVTELVKQKNDGDYRAPDRITLGAYLTERWLPVQQGRLRASTFHSYQRTIELHVLPTLGKVPLARLLPEDLEALYAKLLAEGYRKTKKPTDGDAEEVERRGLSATSVRYVHRILRKALADAQRKGTVNRNVATLADAPSRDAAKTPDMKSWTAHQLRVFLEATTDDRLYPALFLAAHTGMRRGEVLGLKWEDVDLDARRLSVRRALTTVAYELRFSDVKTENARRTIDLDPRTVEVLRTWRRRQHEERLLLGPDYRDDGLVFAQPDGTPLHPEAVSTRFDRLVRAAGAPVIRFHDLRHTHATLLLKAGVPVKVVSERLGHASIGFTLSVYQHVLPGMQAEAATIFARLVAEATEPVVDEAIDCKADESG